MDSDTLTKGGKIIAICFHTHCMGSIQKPGLFWEISQKKLAGDFTPRSVIAVRISNHSAELSGSVSFFGQLQLLCGKVYYTRI